MSEHAFGRADKSNSGGKVMTEKQKKEEAKKLLQKFQKEEQWLIERVPHAKKRKELEYKIQKLQKFLGH